MKYLTAGGMLLAALMALPSTVSAGLGICASGDSQCGDYCCAESCCTKYVPECKTVKEKKNCWQTECEEVCIPPVQLPCCKCLFGGKCTNGCCHNSVCGGCSDSGCCEQSGCCQRECCKDSFLQRLFRRCASGRTRCVSKLKSHEYECDKTVVEWKCVPGGGCCDSGCGTGCCETGACCEPKCGDPSGCN